MTGTSKGLKGIMTPHPGGADIVAGHVPGSRRRRRWLNLLLFLLLAAVIAAIVTNNRQGDVVTARPQPTDRWSGPLVAPSTDLPEQSASSADPTELPSPAPLLTAALPTVTSPSLDIATSAPSPQAIPTAPTRGSYPPAGVDASPAPLGTPVTLAGDDPRYSFTAFQDDGVTPIAYDPCRPIRYVMRPDNAPPDAAALVRAAFDRVTQVTGLQFVDGGTTDEGPSPDRASYQLDRYGDRWVPVLVVWATEAEAPELTAAVAGSAGSTSVRLGDLPAVFVTGSLLLDGPQLSEVWADPDTRASVRAVVLHEMAHLVGLGHIEDPSQLMNPQTSSTSTILDFQAGDLSGLVRLGVGPCVPEV